MEQYYLGFDAGTQSVKTAVYDIDMNLIVQDTNATILNYPHPGWVEMDADQYLHATVTGIRNCVTKMKEKNLDPDNIRSIFGDGIICGIVGVDKDCHAITPYINYLDSRTKEDVGQVLIFESEDKMNWRFKSRIESEEPFGYMWEFPD